MGVKVASSPKHEISSLSQGMVERAALQSRKSVHAIQDHVTVIASYPGGVIGAHAPWRAVVDFQNAGRKLLFQYVVKANAQKKSQGSATNTRSATHRRASVTKFALQSKIW